MNYISFLNSFSFYYIWKEKPQFINEIINKYIGSNDTYELKNYFNFKMNNVRSYLIFESNKNIVFIDFNINNSFVIYENDLLIYEYLKISEAKTVKFIIFDNSKNEDIIKNNVYKIYYKEEDVLFASNKNEQLRMSEEMTNILYRMPNYIYKLYLHEIKLKSNL